MKLLLISLLVLSGCNKDNKNEEMEARLNKLERKITAMKKQEKEDKIKARAQAEENCYSQPIGSRIICLARLDDQDLRSK